MTMWSGNSFGFWHCEWLLIQSENLSTHRQWLATLAERISYNPLPIIMRAVNSLRLRWQSKAAPRWRRGRWKAKA